MSNVSANGFDNVNYKILVVEDEKEIRELILNKLTEAGFLVLGSANGTEALQILNSQQVDVVLLDQILPDMHGLDILHNIRNTEKYSDLPVIILTGLINEDEKVKAFENRADDYVTKPFLSKELIARIRALLRRSQKLSNQQQPLQLINRNIQVDFASYKVFLDENELKLTLTEFKLLSELLLHAGRVLSRDFLRERVLGKESLTDRTIDVHMASLRKKLSFRGKDIQTVRGVGYRFTAA